MQKAINGAMLKSMVLTAAKLLEVNRANIDALNVFPVPDGDTGTNMSLTIQSAVKELVACRTNKVSDIAEAISKGALRGARGNSGVILSQVLRGMCNILKKDEEIDVKTFVQALKNSAEVAYGAVTKPKEGTMLTVARMVAEHAQSIRGKHKDFETFLPEIISAGNKAVDLTPSLLPVLKKAGVVDAGGKGLMCLYEGMYKALMGESVSEEVVQSEVSDSSDSLMEHAEIMSIGDIEFAYCTEFFIINLKKKTTLADIERLRETLMTIGDCVIVIGDLEFVKVHVHTNQPGIALTNALKLGELNGVKIENMLEQFRELKSKTEPEQLKKIGIVSVCAGEGLANLFKDLNVDYVIEGGQTMNPSAEDIAKAADSVYAENVFILPNNKNIILAAELANDLSKRNIFVLPTTSVQQGISAAIAINPEVSVDENKANVDEMIKNVISGSVTYAVRSTSIDGFKLKEGDIIGLGEKKIVAKGENVNKTTEDTIEKLMNEDVSTISLFYGQDVNPVDAGALVDVLKDKYPDLEIDVHEGGQPLYYYLISLE